MNGYYGDKETRGRNLVGVCILATLIYNSDPMLSNKQMVKASIIIFFFYALNKIGGFARLIIVSQRFGAGHEADALAAAMQLPELLFAALAGGALGAALLPIYTQLIDGEDRPISLRVANTLISGATLFALILIFCGTLFARPLAQLLVQDSVTQSYTAQLIPFAFIYVGILGISTLYSSFLQAHNHFALPAAATFAVDVGGLCGLWWLAPRYGVIGVGWGLILGATLHFLVQWPIFGRYQLHYHPQWAWHLPPVKAILRLAWPRLLTISISQAADLWIFRLATQQTGHAALYSYAVLIIYLPISLITWAVTTVVFPTMARQFNSADSTAQRTTYSQTLALLWGLLFPCALALLALGPAAIAFILERGQFTSADTKLTYLIIIPLSARILLETTLDLVQKVYFAHHNTRIPLIGQLLWFITQIISATLFFHRWGIVGLALATTLAFAVLLLFLWIVGQKAGIVTLDWLFFGRELRHIIIATTLMVITILTIRTLGWAATPTTLTAITLGSLTYIFTYLWLKPTLLHTLRNQQKRSAS